MKAALALVGALACARAAAPPAGVPGRARAPGDVLDLADWKLQLPVGEPGAVTEIRQPELRTFVFPPYFQLDSTGRAVTFRAHAGGVTTPHSQYPRTELREMTAGGAANAAWSTTSGTHTMTITQAVNHLPEVKPQVAVGQIHDGTTYVVMIRLEGPRLFVMMDGRDVGTLDAAYVLGRRFTVRIEASDGHIRVYHDDLAVPKVDVARAASTCYFKAGVYTQSNPAHGDAPDAYGEVAIAALTVTHTP